MKDAEEIIAEMKREHFLEAYDRALPIRTEEGETIGKLVPVGEWAVQDAQVIQSICDWRQAFMDMFLVRFHSTPERTRNYLINLSIAAANRIFFLVYDTEDCFVGHIGMAEIAKGGGELDNVMRGIPAGHPRLMHFAQIALLSWCFSSLDMGHSTVRVLSYNVKGIESYKSVGYAFAEEHFLFKRENDGVIYHDTVVKDSANVDYRCITLRLIKAGFYKQFPYLQS